MIPPSSLYFASNLPLSKSFWIASTSPSLASCMMSSSTGKAGCPPETLFSSMGALFCAKDALLLEVVAAVSADVLVSRLEADGVEDMMDLLPQDVKGTNGGQRILLLHRSRSKGHRHAKVIRKAVSQIGIYSDGIYCPSRAVLTWSSDWENWWRRRAPTSGQRWN